MNDIEKTIEYLKERVMFMENFLKEKESMGTIVLDKEKILSSMAINKLSITALEKQLEHEVEFQYEAICPNCKSSVTDKYCSNCGQKLFWGVIENEQRN